MSQFLLADDKYVGDVASNSGWTDVGLWANTLDLEKYPNLIAFVEHGWCQTPQALIAELEAAVGDDPSPVASVAQTAQGLLETLRGVSDADVLVVTDGTGSAEDIAEEV